MRIPELRLDEHGGWFVDGERIEHARTLQVLTENVRMLADGTFVTSIGRETAPVRVDDAAFFVRTAVVDARGLVLSLSDRSEETQKDPALRSEADGRLYCRVKEGRAWARFSSAAHQALAERWTEEQGRIGLVVCDRFVAVY